MSRKGRVAKRDVLPDPVYNSKTISKLINNIMLDGKKGVAQKIVYGRRAGCRVDYVVVTFPFICEKSFIRA